MAAREKTPGWLSRIAKRGGSSGANQDDTAKAAHERRREQIRRAQRTHRERKDLYVKNIEAEVVMLREKDAAHQQALTALKLKISDLNQILLSNGIPVPPELFHIEFPQAAITVQTQADGSQNLRATMPSSTTSHSQTWSQSDTLPRSTTTTTNSEISDLVSSYDRTTITRTPSIPLPLQSGQNSSQPRVRGHPHDLDAAQVAVDFVLDLERPCLSHHGVEVHDGEFSGHRLMVQTPIMASSSTPGPVYDLKPGGELSTSATWTVPAFEMERLLNFSTRLSLAGELTPIEAWQKIKQHPGFAGLNRESLQQLKEALLPEVQCYGFGAVMDEQQFNFLLEQHLGTPGVIF